MLHQEARCARINCLPSRLFAGEQDDRLLSIFRHTSHTLQPLDVGYFGPLKQAFSKEIRLVLSNGATRLVLTSVKKGCHFEKTFLKAATCFPTVEIGRLEIRYRS
jgi:hypothetical protein